MVQTAKTYTISELSRDFDVTPRALRFYEDKGLLAPRREGLARIYTDRERARLKIILHCKRLGFPLSDIKQMIDLYDLDDGGRTQMAVSLEKYRQRLADLKAQHMQIGSAIDEIEKAIAWLVERQPTMADAR